MSDRSRSARRLASILKQESGAKWVELRYHREHQCYAVHWEGDPSKAEMYRLVAEHADDYPWLSMAYLVWLRTEPYNR